MATSAQSGQSLTAPAIDRCTPETGHSMSNADDPIMNDRSGTERTGAADPDSTSAAQISPPWSCRSNIVLGHPPEGSRRRAAVRPIAAWGHPAGDKLQALWPDREDGRTPRPLQAAVTYHIAFGPHTGQKVLT